MKRSLSAPGPEPPVWLVLPDGQELRVPLLARRQTPFGWRYEVEVPAWTNPRPGEVEAGGYRVWVRAPEHVRPVDGADYSAVPTERLTSPRPGPRPRPGRPSQWALHRPQRGPDTPVLHAPGCAESGSADQWLDQEQAVAAARAGARRCQLCGAAYDLDPHLEPGRSDPEQR